MRLLNSAQYGYRLHNGILMPLYNLLNSRALDSIPRNLQRLGVPPDLAEWFVSLDDNGTAVIDTPFYASHKLLKSSNV